MIKNKWDEVTIGEYQSIIALFKNFNVETDDPLEHNISLLTILSDKDKEYFEAIPITQLSEHIDNLSFIHTPIPHAKVVRYYNLGDKKFEATGTAYKISQASAKDLKAIQYIDHLTLWENPELNTENLHLMLAVYLIPKGESYGSEGFSISKNAELIQKHMKICDALAVSDFFLLQFKASIHSTVNYLESIIKKAMKKNPQKAQALKEKLKMLKSLGSPKDLWANGDGDLISALLPKKTISRQSRSVKVM